MESTLKGLRGVLDVAARLLESRLGEAEVLYNPDEVTLVEIEEAIRMASGKRHTFKVIALGEGG